MQFPFDAIFDVVRRGGDIVPSFEALRSIGAAKLPSALWNAVQQPPVEEDVAATAAWLGKNLEPHRPTGVYIGLDTLNQWNNDPYNLEIGWSGNADPGADTIEWAWRPKQRGSKHLVTGIRSVHEQYRAFELRHPTSLLPDYVFFFGYSGLILAAALERLPVKWPSLVVWGFHDDSLAKLATTSEAGIKRIAGWPKA